MRRWMIINAVALGGLLAGCAVGPNYHRPDVTVGSKFSEAGRNVSTNSPAGQWWRTFNDPELEKLVDEALRTNYDLQIASARIREARYNRNITAADLFPNVDADGGYARSLGSKNVVLPLGGGGGAGGSGSGAAGAVGTGQSSGNPTSGRSAATRTVSADPPGAGGANDPAFDNQLTPLGKGGLPGATTDLYQAGFDATWEIDVFGW
jgi:outer membrane protein TolC